MMPKSINCKIHNTPKVFCRLCYQQYENNLLENIMAIKENILLKERIKEAEMIYDKLKLENDLKNFKKRLKDHILDLKIQFDSNIL